MRPIPETLAIMLLTSAYLHSSQRRASSLERLWKFWYANWLFCSSVIFTSPRLLEVLAPFIDECLQINQLLSLQAKKLIVSILLSNKRNWIWNVARIDPPNCVCSYLCWIYRTFTIDMEYEVPFAH